MVERTASTLGLERTGLLGIDFLDFNLYPHLYPQVSFIYLHFYFLIELFVVAYSPVVQEFCLLGLLSLVLHIFLQIQVIV